MFIILIDQNYFKIKKLYRKQCVFFAEEDAAHDIG